MISGPRGTECEGCVDAGGTTSDTGADVGKARVGVGAVGVCSSAMLFFATDEVSITVGRGLEPEPGLGVGGSELFSRRKCGDAPCLEGTVLLR